MKHLVVLRHGERADYAPTLRETLVQGDPPLTETGLIQAEIAAEEIIKQLPPCESYCVISSPFLRCIETASKIAKRLDIPIMIEEGFGEIMRPQYFDGDILDKIVYKTRPELIENEHGVKLLEGKLELRPKFPEKMAESIRRTHNAWNSIFPLYSQYQCIIIVTHLFIVDELYKLWTKRVDYNDGGYCKMGICEYSEHEYKPKIIPYSWYVDERYSLLNNS